MNSNNLNPQVTRRSMLGLAALAGSALALSGCDTDSDSDASSTGTDATIEGAYDSNGAQLVISTWGFNSDQKRELVFEPFEKAFNCTITVEEGNNGDRLAKIQQKPESYDIIQLSDYYMQQAIDAGLVAKISPSDLSNYDSLYDKAKTPNGEGYGPAYTFTRLGIVYDKSVITEPITSWADLWRSDLAGKLTIPDFSTTAGPWMLNIAAGQLGQELTADNAQAAMDKLAELKPNLVKIYTKSSDVVNMFNQGEVSCAVILDFSSLTIQEASDDFVWVDPTEGTWGSTNVTDVCAKSANADLAKAFINYTLDKDEQTRNAQTGDAPSRPDVELTEDEAKGMTYGEDVANSIQLPDLELLIENKATWQSMWNNQLNTNA